MPSPATATSWGPPTRKRPRPAPSARISRRASSRTSCTARMRPTPLPARSPTSSAPRSCARATERAHTPAMIAAAAERTNLLGLPRPELTAFVAQLGSQPFRARQLMNWIYKRGADTFAEMSDLAKDFRARLALVAEVRTPEIAAVQRSGDGTRKWLLRADAAQAFEMVFIPEPDRGTLCISSQVGCALDCSFCSTAQQGYNRNLTTAEIVGQVWLANRELSGSFAHDPARERVV